MKTTLTEHIQQLPESIQTDITNICKIQDNEKRWHMIRVCCLAYAPELIDNQTAWNLYQETV